MATEKGISGSDWQSSNFIQVLHGEEMGFVSLLEIEHGADMGFPLLEHWTEGIRGWSRLEE